MIDLFHIERNLSDNKNVHVQLAISCQENEKSGFDFKGAADYIENNVLKEIQAGLESSQIDFNFNSVKCKVD